MNAAAQLPIGHLGAAPVWISSSCLGGYSLVTADDHCSAGCQLLRNWWWCRVGSAAGVCNISGTCLSRGHGFCRLQNRQMGACGG